MIIASWSQITIGLYEVSNRAEKPDNVTFLLNNCTFSGCSVSLSDQATSGSSEECIEETLKDINVHDLFDN